MNESERVKLWTLSKRKICPNCGDLMYYKSNTCKNCTTNSEKSEIIKKQTIGYYRSKIEERGLHPSWLHGEIRAFARFWNKDLLKEPCQNCNYSKHVELCHIKSISSFPDNALLGEINAKENLKVLCRNCHWEFDNGLL